MHWEMSHPLKVSVKLILITRGKAAVPSCQPRQCPAPVSAAESLLSGATGSVWGKRHETSGKCFFAAVEESPGSTTEKMLFQEDCCGSDAPKTYLTQPVQAHNWRETLCGDADLSSSLRCKLKLHHIKQRKCSFSKGGKYHQHNSQGPSLVGHPPAAEITTELYFLLTEIFTNQFTTLCCKLNSAKRQYCRLRLLSISRSQRSCATENLLEKKEGTSTLVSWE